MQLHDQAANHVCGLTAIHKGMHYCIIDDLLNILIALPKVATYLSLVSRSEAGILFVKAVTG